jgi:tetratricopeptide (TPR) repeat protein
MIHPRNPLALLLAILVFGSGCTNHVVHRERGYEDYRAGEYAAATEDFRKAVDLKAADYKAQYYLGASLLKQGLAIQAQTALEQALAARDDDPQWTPKIADLLAESYYEQERIETLYGFLDRMIADYNQRTVDYLRKAEYLGRLGDADGQKEALQKAAFFAPEGDAGPYLAIAEFYMTVNDIPNAKQALRYGYYVDPDNEDVKNRLRGLGLVPGPTLADAPPKPALLD